MFTDNSGGAHEEPDRLLWEALQKHALATGCAPVKTILIFNVDDAGRQIYPDGRREEWWGDTLDDPKLFPPLLGWAFRCGEASYMGKVFKLGGLRRRLLRVLAERPGEPIPDRLVKLRVWESSTMEDERLKDLAYQLRAVLRAALGLAEDVDPVERVEGGYRLALT